MSRRGKKLGLLRVCALVPLALAIAIPGAAGESSQVRIGGEPASRPNILLIITDDQRASTVRDMPKTRAAFRDATTYKGAYTVTNACCPSRASIYTGRYPHNHGVLGNGQAENLDQASTLQAYLDEAGYNTALVGKYFNSWVEDPPHFDLFSALQGPPRHYYRGGQWNIDGVVQRIDRYATNFIRDRALAYLEAFELDDETPWLMVVTPTAPHYPYVPAPKYADAPLPAWNRPPAEEDLSDKPPYVTDQVGDVTGIKRTRWRQVRSLMSVDDLVGRLDAELKETDERRTTVAFYTSDSGFLWGEHGLLGKSNPYTPASRIPLMVRGRSLFEPRARNYDLVGSIDIAPTIYGVTGITPDANYPVDGDSLLAGASHEYLLHSNPALRASSLHALDYQYSQTRDDDSIFEEYYDLVADPHQLESLLADDDPSNDPDVESLREALRRAESCSGDSCP